jgi:RimJ/RimL family protein N-acetyltransferase
MNEFAKFPVEQLRIDYFDNRALDASFIWLNDPEIQTMIDGHPVERDAQLSWFETLDKRTDILIKSIWHKTTPIGVMGLKHLTDFDAEYWGYLGDKNYWGRQIGPWMIAEAIKLGYACGIQRLYLKVLPNNERALRLYKKAGFNLIDNEYNSRFFLMELMISVNTTNSKQ